MKRRGQTPIRLAATLTASLALRAVLRPADNVDRRMHHGPDSSPLPDEVRSSLSSAVDREAGHCNEGSRQHQAAQRDQALRWGWQPSYIEVIDDDLGISGLDPTRPGYRRMLGKIETGVVGAVFISEVSRAGRDDRAWMDFLKLLALHDVLLFENGVPTDPHDDDQVFVKKIQALTVHRENQLRMTLLHRGRLSKGRGGKAVSVPPIGFIPVIETRDGIPVRTGAWVKDPDPLVRESIEAVFRAFREGRSLVRTVRLLKKWGVKIPSRRRTTP